MTKWRGLRGLVALFFHRAVGWLERRHAVPPAGPELEGPPRLDLAPRLALELHALDGAIVRRTPVAVARVVVPRDALLHGEERREGPQVRA